MTKRTCYRWKKLKSHQSLYLKIALQALTIWWLSLGQILNSWSIELLTLLAQLYYVFMSSSGSYKLQFELSENKLLVEENGIVLDQNSGYQCIIDGALVDAVKGQEFSISIKFISIQQ
ncbi:unnamed protein product [Blepharisma stoltei]|uniref:Uncharacterized protein n=1 Tax=Blepharisma stoltei TaxID=1481888 RepID=A0AAU9K4J9_9CILI|nr:unnamed protein product [Blepharisma stoltei]